MAILAMDCGTPQSGRVLSPIKQERSALLSISGKDRYALADSIRVRIEIAAYREHGQDAHATLITHPTSSKFMRRKQWFTIHIPSLMDKIDPSANGLEISTDRPGPWIQIGMPRRLVWKRASLPIREMPTSLNGLRILHLSDLHLGREWGTPYDAFLIKLQNDPPDLIFFTGDFVEDRYDHRGALPTVRRFLAGLKARQGIYAIFGNHDPDVMYAYLRDTGIRFITHQREIITIADARIELIGFPGQARHDLDPDFVASLPSREAGLPRIVLSHYPDLLGAALPLDPDLYLCGHTHGGQICLPNGWPGLTHDGMPRRFSKGIHRVGQTWYAVSNGFGFTGVSIRLFCPAEVVEFVLRGGQE